MNLRMVRTGFVAAVLVAVTAGIGSSTPLAGAAGPPGTSDFSISAPAQCTVPSPPSSSSYDAVLDEGGSNPSSVTVGERIQIDVDRLDVPGAIGAGSRVLRLRVTGPVTPSGDLSVYAPDTTASLVLKATGAGAVTVALVSTQGVTNYRGQNVFTVCAPKGGAVALTSFVATTRPVCLGVPATIVGTSGPDDLRGTAGPDVIYAGSGDDVVTAGRGDDIVCGAHGVDTIDGGAGRDRVDGGYADDTIHGGDGRDWIDGGSGRDTVDGGPGIDTCRNGEVLASC